MALCFNIRNSFLDDHPIYFIVNKERTKEFVRLAVENKLVAVLVSFFGKIGSQGGSYPSPRSRHYPRKKC